MLPISQFMKSLAASLIVSATSSTASYIAPVNTPATLYPINPEITAPAMAPGGPAIAAPSPIKYGDICPVNAAPPTILPALVNATFAIIVFAFLLSPCS